MKKLVPIVLLAAALAAAAYFYLSRTHDDPHAICLSGNLELTEVQIAFKAAGRIAEITVKEGDKVQPGQLLARLDPEALEAQKSRETAGLAAAESALAQSQIDLARQTDVLAREESIRRAELALAESQLRDLNAGPRPQELEQAQAALADAAAQLRLAQADWDRAQKLFRVEDISRAQYEQAQTRLASLTQAHRAAAQKLSLLQEGARPESRAQAQSQIARAQAALQLTLANHRDLDRRRAELDLRRADSARARANLQLASSQLADLAALSPLAATVLSRPAEPGEVVAPGVPVLVLGRTDRPWLRGYITESQLGKVKIGHKATLSTDSYLNKTYPGTVTYISPEAEFTPKQIQTPEERVKLV
jgi:HlyD family secretion protein